MNATQYRQTCRKAGTQSHGSKSPGYWAHDCQAAPDLSGSIRQFFILLMFEVKLLFHEISI